MTLRADPRAPGLVIGDEVRIGDGVYLGAHVVIHSGTVIGEGSIVEDQAILGKPPQLRRGSSAEGDVGRLELGADVRICSGAIVFAGAKVAEGAIIGDRAFVRERSSIGPGSLVGHASVVESDVRIGARVKIQTGVYLTAFSEVEDEVFIGPGALTTNDDTMGRHGGPESGFRLRGAVLRRGCRVGGGTVLTPGVEVGEEAFVAAGAVVTRDVPARAVVMGIPGRPVREVPAEDLLK